MCWLVLRLRVCVCVSVGHAAQTAVAAARKLKKEELLLLKSREVIAVNQDPLGVAGDRVWKQGPYEVGSH